MQADAPRLTKEQREALLDRLRFLAASAGDVASYCKIKTYELRALLADYDARGEALRKCEEQFDHYAELHLAKTPPDYPKADTNKSMADEIRRVLAAERGEPSREVLSERQQVFTVRTVKAAPFVFGDADVPTAQPVPPDVAGLVEEARARCAYLKRTYRPTEESDTAADIALIDRLANALEARVDHLNALSNGGLP